MEGGERIVEQEGMCMTDKQYDGMLKDQIASLDRIAKITKVDEVRQRMYI